MSSEHCSYRTRCYGVETSPKAVHFWKSGFKFAFRRNRSGKVFRILSLLKKRLHCRKWTPIFRSFLRVSLLFLFPHPQCILHSDPTMQHTLSSSSALYVSRVVVVLFSQKIMVEQLVKVTSEYEERLRMYKYVPRFSFGRRMLRDDGAPNRFFQGHQIPGKATCNTHHP